jgi:FkbM family methyltransferase
MNIKLIIAHFIRWHELKLAWKVFSREYILQHNIFGAQWEDFDKSFNDQSLNALLKDLDDESIATVHLLLKRFSNPFSRYPSLYPKQVFSNQELEEQRAFEIVKHTLGHKYDIPVSEVDPSPMMYQSGLSFVPENAKLKIKDSAILDIGAFIGQASLSFLDFQPATIYPFEPSLTNFKKLSHGLASHIQAKQIIPVNCALGDKKGVAEMSDAGNASSMVSSSSSDQKQKVKIDTVDDFTKENKIPRVGLMKLDVEGFETNVIHGAIETIKRDKPILLISIYHTPADFFEMKIVLEKLNLGYRFIIRKTNPFWLTYDTMLICYVA